MADLDASSSVRPPSTAAGTRDHQFRAGGRVLSLFSTALPGLILRAISAGPLPLSELRARAGGPTRTTLRGNIGNLIGIGALEKRGPAGESDLLDNELTPFGKELLFVAETLEIWLSRAPAAARDFGDDASKAAVKALIAAWGSTILRALAARPLTLSKLDELISSFSRAALERRLKMMLEAGQVESIPSGGDSASYAVTDWLREGVAPLLAAIRCERLYLPAETAPVGRIDVEAALLLAMPLIGPLGKLSGACQLAVDIGEGTTRDLAGVSVEIDAGEIVSWVSRLEPSPRDWAVGSVGCWLDAAVEGNVGGFERGGVDGTSIALIDGLHRRLFAP